MHDCLNIFCFSIFVRHSFTALSNLANIIMTIGLCHGEISKYVAHMRSLKDFECPNSFVRWHKNLSSYFPRGMIVRMLRELFSWPPSLKFFLWQSIRNLCIIVCNCRTWNDRDWGQSRVVILDIIRTSRIRASLINHFKL